MSDNRKYVTVKPTRLVEGISSVAMSFTVAEIKDGDGNVLTMTDFGTQGFGAFEPRTEGKKEQFTFTGISGNTVTMNERGLAMKSPYTDAGNQTDHAAGTIVLLYTNSPAFYNSFPNKFNEEFIANEWTYDEDFRPKLDVDLDSSDETALATVGQVNRTAAAGAADATETIKGLVEIATQAQNDAGTVLGETGASIVPTPDKIAKSVQKNAWTYAADAQASDTYVITLSVAPAAYAAGQSFIFKANTANTGAATLNINSLGAKTIKKVVAGAVSDLENNDILAGMLVMVAYDGTNLYMLNTPGTSISSAIAFEVTSVFSATDITGAELETLSAGATSDANTLHKHGKKFGVDSFAPTGASDTKVITHNLGVIPRLIRIKYAASANSGATQSRGEGVSDGTTYATIYLAKTGNPLYDWDTDTSHIIVADDVTASAGWNATLTTITTTQFTIDVDTFTAATDIVFTWEVE